MGDESQSRYEAMVEFLSFFPTLSGTPPTTIEDLSDGVALFEALSEIAPDYFDATTIARHLGDNWALKSSNLRKLIRNLEDYYHEGLSKDADFGSIVSQVSNIAKTSDKEAIGHLFELAIAAAVTCDNRSEFVGRIMNMSQQNQIQMKSLIETSLKRLTDLDTAERHHDQDDEKELVFGQDETETSPTYQQQAQDKDKDDTHNSGDGIFSAGAGSSFALSSKDDNADGQDDLQKALSDARRELAHQKSQANYIAEDTQNAHKKLKALVGDLQDRLEKRQNDLMMVEGQYKMASMELEDAKARLDDMDDKNAQLADDLDVAIAKAEQLRKAEATVVAYRKKLEGFETMSQQVKDLEDQAENYLKQIVTYEADAKKIPALQKTIDDLRDQLATKERESVDAGSAAKGSITELNELKSKLSAAESAKKMYQEELEELRAQQGMASDDDLASTPVANLAIGSSPKDKEKRLKLEAENTHLKEQVAHLKSNAVDNAASAASTATDVQALNTELQKLKEQLAKKDAEKTKLGSDKEKLEAYTKRTLAKFQEKYLVALQECKLKLKEKQDKIEALENRSQSEKTAQKREERLLSSTIYELGLTIMQTRLKER